MPEGVTYHPPGGEESQDHAVSGVDDDDKEVDIVRCGNFSINIEIVTKP